MAMSIATTAVVGSNTTRADGKTSMPDRPPQASVRKASSSSAPAVRLRDRIQARIRARVLIPVRYKVCNGIPSTAVAARRNRSGSTVVRAHSAGSAVVDAEAAADEEGSCLFLPANPKRQWQYFRGNATMIGAVIADFGKNLR
jgi:hypothetical protein